MPFGGKYEATGKISRGYSCYILIEILLKKVQHRKCDPLGPIDRPNLHNYIWIEILLKKVQRRKCDPLGPVDRPNFHNYILIEILLKKVRRRKCDPLFVKKFQQNSKILKISEIFLKISKFFEIFEFCWNFFHK